MSSRMFKFGVAAASACVGSVVASWSIDRWNSPHVVCVALMINLVNTKY